METSIKHPHAPAVALALLLAVMASCNKVPDDGGQGTLRWSFRSGILARSPVDIPDTDSFILTVSNSANEILYRGPYGDSPESMPVNPGSYTVKAVSRTFESPQFEAPQFGDEKVVVVAAGEETRVSLDCSQLNCGLRLKIDPYFSTLYPSGFLSVVSGEGSLRYDVGESRVGYFFPGNLSVVLNDGQSSSQLLTRNLARREMLTLGIACPSGGGDQGISGARITIAVDTLRTWNEEDYTIGGDQTGAGVTKERAYSVNQAREHPGEKGVWVFGYIVGGDLSSSKNGIKFAPPFELLTCLAIAARSSVADKASCMSVQLAKGEFRDDLNLVDHPGLIGRKIYLKGDIEPSYYGIPGIKNLSTYNLD